MNLGMLDIFKDTKFPTHRQGTSPHPLRRVSTFFIQNLVMLPCRDLVRFPPSILHPLFFLSILCVYKTLFFFFLKNCCLNCCLGKEIKHSDFVQRSYQSSYFEHMRRFPWRCCGIPLFLCLLFQIPSCSSANLILLPG